MEGDGQHNGGLAERLNEDEQLTEQEKERILEQAEIFKNSAILKSYELLIQRYEHDQEAKNAQLREFERQLTQIQIENSNMAQQLLTLKSHSLNQAHNEPKATIESEANKLFGRDERDHLVELLKRNHDVMVDKYEEQRQLNQMLDKNSSEKERLYNEIKLENDHLANQSYKLSRLVEDLSNEKRIYETKLKNCESILRTTQEDLRAVKSAHDKADSTCKLLGEQLDSAKKTVEEITVKKQQEFDLINKEVASLSLKERDAKQRAYLLEGQVSEARDELRIVSQELDSRSRENEHLVQLLEDQEQKIALYEQKERAVQLLAQESKKKIEEANQERDKVLLKETQYLRQIARLEERVKSEGAERQERHDKIMDSIRSKHKSSLDQRDDEISDLRLKLSDAKEASDRFRVERDSLRIELDKIHEQLRSLKDDQSQKYDTYSKQISQSETLKEEKVRLLQNDNERLKEETEGLRKNYSQQQITMHEQGVKLDSYMRDYERYFDENKRLRELVNTLRDEKDIALSEIKRLKSLYHDRVNELNDECNLKIAQLENALLETKERSKMSEEKSYEVMMMQERILEKWKAEHRSTVDHYEKNIKAGKAENRHLSERVIELKGMLRLEKENNDDNIY